MANAFREASESLCAALRRIDVPSASPTPAPHAQAAPGPLSHLSAKWEAATTGLLRFLSQTVPTHPAPKDQSELEQYYGEVMRAVQAIGDFSDYTYSATRRGDSEVDLTSHVRAVQEAAPAFFWVAEKSSTAAQQYIQNLRESTEFYTTKAVTAAAQQQQQQQHTQAMRELLQCLTAMQTMVGSTYAEGLPWATGGGSAPAAQAPQYSAPYPPAGPRPHAASRTNDGTVAETAAAEGDASPTLEAVVAAFTALADEADNAGHSAVVKESVSKLRHALKLHNGVLAYASTHAKPADVEAFLAPTEAALRDAGSYIQRAQQERSNTGSIAQLQRLGDLVEHLAWIARSPTRPAPYLASAERTMDAGVAVMIDSSVTITGQTWANLVHDAAHCFVRYVRQTYPRGLHFIGGRRLERRRQLLNPADVRETTLTVLVEAASRTESTDVIELSGALYEVARQHGLALDAVRSTVGHPPAGSDEFLHIMAPLNSAVNAVSSLSRAIVDHNDLMRREAHAVADSANLFVWLTADRPVLAVEEGFADVDFNLQKVCARCAQTTATNIAIDRAESGAAAGDSTVEETERRATRQEEQLQAAAIHYWARTLRDAMLKLVLFVSYRYPHGAPWGADIMAPMASVNGGTSGAASHSTAVQAAPPAVTASTTAPPPPPLPPPPPPPPPPPQGASRDGAGGDGGSDVQRMFAEINRQGLDITKNLRHVTAEEKAASREAKAVAGAVGAGSAAPAAAPAAAAARYQPTGAARCELTGGKKWMLENLTYTPAVDDPENAARDDGVSGVKLVGLREDELEKAHILFITRCQHTYVRVPAKVNTVQILQCAHVQLELQDTIGPVEITSCEAVEVLIHGACPTVTVDKTDGVTLHLAGSQETEIVTSSASNVNVTVPQVDEDGDTVARELAIPQQFISVIGAKDAIKTNPVSHASGG